MADSSANMKRADVSILRDVFTARRFKKMNLEECQEGNREQNVQNTKSRRMSKNVCTGKGLSGSIMCARVL